MTATQGQARTFKPAYTFANEQANFLCVANEAQHWDIPLPVFLAVNSIEQGKTTPISNKNGSKDLGAFQINTIHLDMVQRNFAGSKQDLLHKGCFNAHVAGYLLHRAINEPKKRHLDYYSRVSGYHSWTPKYNQRYRTKLVKYTEQWQVWLKKNGHIQ